MFDTIPTYNAYRTLSLQKPVLQGEDIYALQHALNSLGFFTGGTDGFLGPKTDWGIRSSQRFFKLDVDGKAGGMTQTALAMAIAANVALDERVPEAALRGSLEHESGFRLGNYSPAREDGHYDAGVAQRNTRYTSPENGFNPRLSIVALAQNTRKHYDLFSGIMTNHRRWALAQGGWNSPAFACYLAREEGAIRVTANMTLRPSASSRHIFEAYIAKVSKHLAV